MMVPIDLLKPILDDMLTMGRPNHPPRPWLGLYASEVEDNVVVVGLAQRGPAAKADLRAGDVLMAVGGVEVSSLGDLFRRIWATGSAGVEVPMTISREGRVFEARVASTDRNRLLKGPTLQ
jgi:S1-C subfamily serine protease